MSINPNSANLAICGIFGIGLAYSIGFNFLNFMFFSDKEKLTVFFGLSFFLFSVLLLFPNNNFSTIVVNLLSHFSIKQKVISGVIVIGLSISAFLSSLSYIPTVTSFDLTVLVDESGNNINRQIKILQINRLDVNGQYSDQVSPHSLTLHGNWKAYEKSLTILSSGGDSIQFTDYSNKGISLLLQKSPESGKVNVNWNGISQIIDLKSEAHDQVVFDFPYKFAFQKMSLFRLFLVSFLLICDLISIGFLFFLFLLIVDRLHGFQPFFCKNNIFQKAILLLIPITIISGFGSFRDQAVSSFKLLRQNSNTILSLGGDELAYVQVFYKISKYYNGYNLIVPSGFMSRNILPKSKFSEKDFLEIGQLDSVSEEDYLYELSSVQIENTESMVIDRVPPSISVIPYDVEFVGETNSENKVICFWMKDGSIYLIPAQNGIDCRERK
jgi:hypothetical protein